MSGNKDYRTYILYYMLPINDERILIIAIYYVVCAHLTLYHKIIV